MALSLFLPALGRAQTPQVVWDFDQAISNRLGGAYNVFSRSPSSSRSYLDPEVNPKGSRHSLRITAHRAAEGFCGVWLDFYPAASNPPRYVDASAYRYLSFWLKGQKGGEEFDIALKDSTWPQHEDTNPTVNLRRYLPKGAPSEWRQVLIPLADFQGLNPRALAGMTISFVQPGDYRVYLDNLGFTSKAGAPPADNSTARPARLAASLPRALWVWDTEKLFDPAEAERFLEFCSRQSVGQVYLSVGLKSPNGNSPAGTEAQTGTPPRFQLLNAEAFRTLLEKAHQHGLQVDALAGTPEWAVKEDHPLALAAVDAVLEFNRGGAPAARFDGVHFDVEPYSLIGYADPAFREQILTGFVEMVAACAERARTEGHIRFGCDIPWWFYPSDAAGRQELSVNFRGQIKTVGEHLSDLLDTVTIMDYRNEADGAGGIIASGTTALEYAASKGHKIQVGLETFLEPDRNVYFVCGLPRDEFRARLAKSDLRGELYLDGFRLSTFEDKANVHAGLMAPNNVAEPLSQVPFQNALARLARDFGGCSSNPAAAGTALEAARVAISRNPEWQGFERFEMAAPEGGGKIIGFRAVSIMSPNITFHGLGRETFEEETRSTTEWLSRYTSFAGLAVHFYEPYRDLVEGPAAPAPSGQ